MYVKCSIFKCNIAFRTIRSQTFQWEKKRPQAAKIGTQIVTDSLKRRCIATPGTSSGSENSSSTQSGQLPGIDIFLNPEKKDGKDQIVAQKQKVAKDYFDQSDMRSLYPKLFDVLWDSTLPCCE